MAYAIFLTKKLKTWGQIAGSASHVQRTRETPNADLNQENIWIIGNREQDLISDTKNHIGNQKIRKNGVLCVELLLSASPEYFRPSSEEQAEKYYTGLLNRWFNYNQRWLEEKFNSHVISAVAHLDESTPHIHAHFVPIDDRNKLNASAFFDGRIKMQQWQDSYAQWMEPLGLERGIRGSKATHIDIERYYGNINAPVSNDISVLQDKARDRDRAEKQRREMELTVRAKQKEVDKLQLLYRQLELQIDGLNRQLAELSKPQQNISLESVAYQIGFERDRKLTEQLLNQNHGKVNPSLWRGHNTMLLIHNNTKFTISSGEGNKSDGDGGIDLVQQVLNCNQQASLKWLAERFGDTNALAILSTKILNSIAIYPMPSFKQPAPDESRWSEAKRYLIDTHGINENLLDSHHSTNCIYADNQANIIFLHHLIAPRSEKLKRGTVVTGATVINDKFNGIALSSSRDSGWFGIGLDDVELGRVALTDSPIEVLSLASLNPNPKQPTIFLTANNPTAEPQIKLLQHLQSRGVEIFLAYSATTTGENIATKLSEQLDNTQRVKPQNAHTWNSELLNFNLNRQQQQLSQQQQQPQQQYKQKLSQDLQR